MTAQGLDNYGAEDYIHSGRQCRAKRVLQQEGSEVGSRNVREMDERNSVMW